MAPAQVVEAKDLPPELLGQRVAAAVEGARTAVSAPLLAPVPMPASVASAGVGAAVASPGPEGHERLPVAHAGNGVHDGVLPGWLSGLELESRGLLEAGEPEVWDQLTRKFEARLIRTALEVTRGRRIEAAQKLGIGRNTITRKIQELGLDD
jgi:two-component system nitrogen regulation response regulator GlnG